MTGRLGTYSFLPWLRAGIAGQITAQDQDPAVAARASIGVTLHVTGAPVGATGPLGADISRQVELYGPGDIIGIDSRAIVKTEPRDWVTNSISMTRTSRGVTLRPRRWPPTATG